MVAAVLLTVLAAGSPDPVVIQAGPYRVTASSVRARATELRARGLRLSPDKVVDGMATEAALAAAATASGVAAALPVGAAIRAARTSVLADAFSSSLLPKAAASVSDAEIRRLYHEGNDTLRLQLVVVATRAEAEGLRKRLEAGADVAREATVSLDPNTAGRGGDTGTIARIQIDPALAAAAMQASIGAVFGPVDLKNRGWAVARLVERTVAAEDALPAHRDRIAAYAARQSAVEMKGHALQMLRKSAAVTVDEPFLASLGPRFEPTPTEAARVAVTVGERKVTYAELLPRLRSLSGVGHGGVTLKAQAATAYADEVLLAGEASKLGLEKDPGVQAALLRAEIQALAQEMGRRFSQELPASTTKRDREAHLARRTEAERRKVKLDVDRPAALQAATLSR